MSTFSANDVEAWAAEYPDVPSVKQLVGLIEADRNLPQPSTLRPGSPERLLAEQRQARLKSAAEKLGYKPPVQEIAAMATAEVAKSALIGATLGGSAVGEALDRLPAPEKASRAEKEEDRRKKNRGSSVGLELERKI